MNGIKMSLLQVRYVKSNMCYQMMMTPLISTTSFLSYKTTSNRGFLMQERIKNQERLDSTMYTLKCNKIKKGEYHG